MANRMHRMADALVSIGVVVHVVLHADTRQPPTTLPGMRVYSGAMREQYTRALAAAGDELRLGVVFANPNPDPNPNPNLTLTLILTPT